MEDDKGRSTRGGRGMTREDDIVGRITRDGRERVEDDKGVITCREPHLRPGKHW